MSKGNDDRARKGRGKMSDKAQGGLGVILVSVGPPTHTLKAMGCRRCLLEDALVAQDTSSCVGPWVGTAGLHSILELFPIV